MVALLGPILAQLVSLSIADRTEAREIAGLSTVPYTEYATRPLVAIDSDWRHTRLTLSYSPALTLTTLGEENWMLLVYQTAALTGSYQLRRTLFSVNESVGYGEQSFQQLTLAGGGPTVAQAPGPVGAGGGPAPTAVGTVLNGVPTTGANGTATQAQLRALNTPIHVVSLSTTANVTYTESRNLSYGGELGYTVGGATREAERASYPFMGGPRGSVFARYGWGHMDSVTSTVNLQYSHATEHLGARDAATMMLVTVPAQSIWFGTWNETWTHGFNRNTTVQLGGGLSASRSPVANDGSVVAWTIFPTFNAGVTEKAIVARGTLGLGLLVSSAPTLNLTTLTVDPQLTATAKAAWTRDRFFTGIAGGTAFSISNVQGSSDFQSATGAASVGYILGRAVSVDAGVRGAWQSFGGVTSFPFTYAAFVGLNFGARVPLR